MLELTDTAGAKLHKALASAEMPENAGKCFRIVPKNDKLLTLKIAKPAPSDLTYQYDGEVVLALPKALQSFVKDKLLDIDSAGKLKLTTH